MLGFSDLQADIAATLIRHGIEVHVFNHRSVQGILDMVVRLGAMVGAVEKASQLVERFELQIAELQGGHKTNSRRPVVFFEEWNDPIISGIRWASELIQIAGGQDCFADLAQKPLAKDRIIADPDEVVRRQPDIIIGSWCGRKFQPRHVIERQGWDAVPAVIHGHLYEIKSAYILQPGPAALTEGLPRLAAIIDGWGEQNQA